MRRIIMVHGISVERDPHWWIVLAKKAEQYCHQIEATPVNWESLTECGIKSNGSYLRRLTNGFFDLARDLAHIFDPCIIDKVGHELVRAHQRGGNITLVGHSLGSVFCWQALKRYKVPVELFVTLGSPLRKLSARWQVLPSDLSLPGHVSGWSNIWSPFDWVSVESLFCRKGRIPQARNYRAGIMTHALEAYCRTEEFKEAITI